eukprot:TRINITY_DN571_c0_g1_i2.p1 TRINITY_DN571_c0_g1~~TRINITY_DN571_c0_g1_i2.p1  ORF type:complete len:1409 (+),score=427.07 TRINITY_DN571_c0_g1_i2:436-4227(+)
MGDKVLQTEVPYARLDQVVTLVPNGKGWFHCPANGLWLPADFVRPKGEPRSPPPPRPAPSPRRPAPAVAEPEPRGSASMSSPSASPGPSGPSTPPAPAEREEPSPRPSREGASDGEAEDWVVHPPAGFASCAWRRTRSMQDVVPQEEAPFVGALATVRAVDMGAWVQGANGFYLPRQFLEAAARPEPEEQCGGGDAAPEAAPAAKAHRVPKRALAASALSPAQQRQRRDRGVVVSWSPLGRGGEGRIKVTTAGGLVLRVHASEVRVGPGGLAFLRPGQEVELRVGKKDGTTGGAPQRGALAIEAREVTAPGGAYIEPDTALPVPRVPCKALSHRNAAGRKVSWTLEDGGLKCGEVMMHGAAAQKTRTLLTVSGRELPAALCGTYRQTRARGPLPSWHCGSARLEAKGGNWELSAPGLSVVSRPHGGKPPAQCAKAWRLTETARAPYCAACGGPCVYYPAQSYGATSGGANGGKPRDVQVSLSEAAEPSAPGRLSFDEHALALRASGVLADGAGEERRETSVALCADRERLLRCPETQLELATIVGKVRHLAAEAGVPCDIGDEIPLPRPAGAPQHRSMDVASAAGQRPVCMLYACGACTPGARECDKGVHRRLSQSEPPAEGRLFAQVSAAKRRLIQQKWAEAGGHGELRSVWEVRNPRCAELFRLTEHNLALYNGKPSLQIDGFHGTAPQNVLSIALNGFDPRRRSGQVYGSGEYFAKDPSVSVGYCKGGRFMFLCRLHLGEEGQDKDHVWVDDMKYYVVKQRRCLFQALPLYLLEFEDRGGAGWLEGENRALSLKVAQLAAGNCQRGEELQQKMLGARRPCAARGGAGMHVARTTRLWLGWLQPDMSEEELLEDVRRHLAPVPIVDVVPERSAMRLGAYVTLGRALTRDEYGSLSRKLYRGRYEISVDDESPQCPVRSAQPCPRLTGPSQYCRGWNLRGTSHWHTRCRFSHAPELWPTHGAAGSVRRVAVRRGTAKYDEVCGEFTGRYFADVGCGGGAPGIVAVYEVVNPVLERLYTERKAYLERTYDGVITERELWHGTHSAAVAHVLANGLQPPSDAAAAEACPHSAGKGCTSLCSNRCKHCAPTAHCWEKCHMYGLGIYLADLPEKSHRYVRAPEEYRRDSEGEYRSLGDFRAAHGEAEGQRRWDGAKDAGCTVYAMLRCQTNLGSPYLIEGNLLRGDAMHDVAFPCDPSDMLDRTGQEWDERRTNSSYFVKGQGHTAPSGKAVFNNEYVVFQPWQVWPRYLVLYTFDHSASEADFGR